MRRKHIKGNFKEINKQIIAIGVIFIISIIIGAYLNKIWPSYQSNIIDNVNPAIQYYDSSIGIKDTILSNLKSDAIFMILVSTCALLVVTFPIILIIFMLKGLSIGYTINSIILALKFKSIKMISIILFKNLIIIPGVIILILISFNYLKEILYELKKQRKDNALFLGKRYFTNAIILLFVTVSLQTTLNVVSIGVIKFLVR